MVLPLVHIAGDATETSLSGNIIIDLSFWLYFLTYKGLDKE